MNFDPTTYTTLKQCDSAIRYREGHITQELKKLIKYRSRLMAYEATDQKILKEVNEIQFQVPLLRENIDALPDGELKNEHIKRLNALLLRNESLQARKGFHTVEQLEYVRKSMPLIQAEIDRMLEEQDIIKARRAELVAMGVGI